MDVVKAARGPRVTVAPGTATAAMRQIRAAVAQLQIVHAERQKVRKEIGELIDSVVGDAEESEPRDAAFRAHAVIAPVTKRSGKRLSVNGKRSMT